MKKHQTVTADEMIGNLRSVVNEAEHMIKTLNDDLENCTDPDTKAWLESLLDEEFDRQHKFNQQIIEVKRGWF